MLLAKLTTGELLTIIGIAIPILGGFIWLIYKTGCLVTLIEEMKPDVKKIPSIEIKVDELWRLKTTISSSPIVLNDYGKKILEDSKIADIINSYHDEIISLVKMNSPTNAYKVQETLIDVLSGFSSNIEIQDNLEKSAFKAGTDVNTLLFVAAINIRDMVVNELGFSREEIDEFDPKKNQTLKK